MRAHVRIEKKTSRREAGGFHVVRDDRIIAVGEDGSEVDISRCVTEWRELSKAGDARRLEVVLFGFEVVQDDGSLVLATEADA